MQLQITEIIFQQSAGMADGSLLPIGRHCESMAPSLERTTPHRWRLDCLRKLKAFGFITLNLFSVNAFHEPELLYYPRPFSTLADPVQERLRAAQNHDFRP